MPNTIKPVTESDLIVINTRIENVERRVETMVADSTKQFTEISIKMGVFEANLKTSNEEARRTAQEIRAVVDQLKISNENHANIILNKLDSLASVLGLDGSSASTERLRENLSYLKRTVIRKEETFNDVFKGLVGWAVKAVIILAGVGLLIELKYNDKIPRVVEKWESSSSVSEKR